MKLVKSRSILVNASLFVWVSLLYLTVVESYFRQKYLVDIDFIKEFVREGRPLLIFGVIVTYFLYQGKKLGFIALFCFCMMVSVSLFAFYFVDYNKLALVFTFFYMVTGYLFSTLVYLELNGPLFRPNYIPADIGQRSLFKIPLALKFKNGKEAEGLLTNVGPESCFISIKGPWDKSGFRGKGALIIKESNKKFESSFEVVTHFDKGLGLKVRDNGSFFSWKNFYKIMQDKGIARELNKYGF